MLTKNTQIKSFTNLPHVLYKPKLHYTEIRKNYEDKQMVVRLAIIINSNSKISQMEHCLCLKYVMIHRPDL